MQEIVVFYEKDVEDTYDASTPELLHRALHEKLVSRFNDGYWYRFTPINVETLYPFAEITPEFLAVADLPSAAKAKILSMSKTDKINKARDIETNTANLEEMNNITRLANMPVEEAIKEKLYGRNALVHIFAERSNTQYEKWDIIKLNKVK